MVVGREDLTITEGKGILCFNDLKDKFVLKHQEADYESETKK